MGQTDERKLPADDGSIPLAGIDVDVGDLASFRSLLHRELVLNLGPAGRRIITEHATGPGFGWNTVSSELRALHEAYAYALQVSCHNMAHYLQRAEVLIDAIHEVMEKYQQSDLSADDLIAAMTDHIKATSSWDPSQPRGMSW